MNAVVVDTSAWIPYLAGEPNAALDLALKEGRAYLPPVVAAELLSARLDASDRARLVDFLKELPLCEATFEHWVQVGALRATLGRKGVNLSSPDAHVAQCALDLEGYLMSSDGVFAKVAKACGLKMA